MKQVADKILKPLLKKYLSKTRVYHHHGISIHVPPQVFHPAFFFSTKYLLHYLLRFDLKCATFLELGAGSGLISFVAARKGAIVTATDINETAIAYLIKNSERNNMSIEVIQSDMFTNIPLQQFDIIAINPPYFLKNPATAADYAWYCGEHGSYFDALFGGIHKYIHEQTNIIMVLSELCDINMIVQKARASGFEMTKTHTKQFFWEQNYIYTIHTSKRCDYNTVAHEKIKYE